MSVQLEAPAFHQPMLSARKPMINLTNLTSRFNRLPPTVATQSTITMQPQLESRKNVTFNELQLEALLADME